MDYHVVEIAFSGIKPEVFNRFNGQFQVVLKDTNQESINALLKIAREVIDWIDYWKNKTEEMFSRYLMEIEFSFEEIVKKIKKTKKEVRKKKICRTYTSFLYM